MRLRVASALFIAGSVFHAGLAAGATLGLKAVPPSLSSTTAIVDYLAFPPDGDLSSFGAEVDSANGVIPNGVTEIGFGIGYPLATPTTAATGGFDIFDESGLFLSGDLLVVGFAEDTIELQFGNLGGSAAASFGSSVLALIAFDAPLGPDPFAVLVDGESYEASITISKVAPVPLPATYSLMLALLTSFALVAIWPRCAARGLG